MSRAALVNIADQAAALRASLALLGWIHSARGTLEAVQGAAQADPEFAADLQRFEIFAEGGLDPEVRAGVEVLIRTCAVHAHRIAELAEGKGVRHG